MINARTELQYRIAWVFWPRWREASFVTEDEAAVIQRLAAEKVPSGNCSGIVIAIPGKVW